MSSAQRHQPLCYVCVRQGRQENLGLEKNLPYRIQIHKINQFACDYSLTKKNKQITQTASDSKTIKYIENIIRFMYSFLEAHLLGKVGLTLNYSLVDSCISGL